MISPARLALLNVGAIASVTFLPMAATFGLAAIPLYAFTALTFFVPVSLASAELAAMMPDGGLYEWFCAAFGRRAGLLAIWLQWIEAVSYQPVMLLFAVGSLLEGADNALADDLWLNLALVVGSFWLLTGVSCLGVQESTLATVVGVVGGFLLPTALLLGMAARWLADGRGVEFEVSLVASMPSLAHVRGLVLVVGMYVSFCGMELAAVHAGDLPRPRRDYPRAVALSAALVVAAYVLGGLALAAVVSKDDIDLVDGAMQALKKFCHVSGVPGLVPPVGALVFLGGLAGVNAWNLPPAIGLQKCAQRGDLPEWLAPDNRHGAPQRILLLQAAVVTLLCVLGVAVPSISSLYWIFTALSAQVAQLMYVGLLLAVWRLRASRPPKDEPRAFLAPCVGLLTAAGCASCAFAFALGFVPPDDMSDGVARVYPAGLAAALVVFVLPILWWMRVRGVGGAEGVPVSPRSVSSASSGGSGVSDRLLNSSSIESSEYSVTSRESFC